MNSTLNTRHADMNIDCEGCYSAFALSVFTARDEFSYNCVICRKKWKNGGVITVKLTVTQINNEFELAKRIDRAIPIGFTEQRLMGEIQYKRLVESCEGTPICQVAEKLGGNNYTK